jgi:opacity protein-like surface antigen
MWNSARFTFVLLFASFALAHGASAVMEEDEGDESVFVRKGFYLGVGGTAAFPHNWNSDFDGELNDEATDLANQNAQLYLDFFPPGGDSIVPLSITVDGADLEDAQFGMNGVLGYRAGALVAFEVEGEWLITSNKTHLDVNAKSEPQPGNLIRQSSTGSHAAEVSEIWNITANVKIYPPFIGWLRHLERFQPFAKVGLGAKHSKLDIDIETAGLATTNERKPIDAPPPLIVAPADFQIKRDDTNIDGVLRVGGGIDIYATRNIVSEINATYVLPFSDVGFLKTDYVSVQWRLVYRF